MKQKVINKTVLISIFLAAAIWGAWAYIVNRQSDNVITTTVLQVIYSTVMTVYMSYSIHFVFMRLNKKWAKLILPTVITVGHTGFVLILIHYLNNTFNLFKTVTPPLIVATAYSLFLSWKYFEEISSGVKS